MKNASDHIIKSVKKDNIIATGRSTITLRAVKEIMLNLIDKHISKKLNEEFGTLKKKLVSLSRDLFMMSLLSNEKISKLFISSVKNGMNILVHGYSSTVFYCLIDIHSKGININVFVTESRPDNTGPKLVEELSQYKINAKLIYDSSVAYYLNQIDIVVVGADAVVESGGIINKIGTYTIGICAQSLKKPMYVLVESLKFVRMFPLDQSDIVEEEKNSEETRNQVNSDYTPPELITFLFTDLGIFTPSAVSDELIQMFNK